MNLKGLEIRPLELGAHTLNKGGVSQLNKVWLLPSMGLPNQQTF